MSVEPTLPRAQLLAYRFGPNANFEGRLVGALERIESGGTLRVLDAVFVGRDPQTGELVATDLSGDAAGSRVAPLLSFRLEPAERRRATERTLAGGAIPPDALRELASALDPGAAMVAVLVEHAWARVLEEAVSRTGGTPLLTEFVDVTALSDVAATLLAALRRRSAG